MPAQAQVQAMQKAELGPRVNVLHALVVLYMCIPESRHVHEIVELLLLSIVGMRHRQLVSSSREARLIHVKVYVLHTNERERKHVIKVH